MRLQKTSVLIGILLVLVLVQSSIPAPPLIPKTGTVKDTGKNSGGSSLPSNLTSDIAMSAGTVNVQSLPQIQVAISNPNTASEQDDDLAQAKLVMQTPGYSPPGQDARIVFTASSPSASPSSATVNTQMVLMGAGGVSPNPCGCSPPDPNLAVGPNHVFEMVNVAGIIYTKTGNVAKATFGLDTFFNLQASSMSDPEIMYDGLSGRWFASIVNIQGASIVLAVSASSDPTGNFTRYTISAGGRLPDQPFIGANSDKLVITANDFQNIRGGIFLGSEYWILNKSELLNGLPSIHFTTNTPDSTIMTLRPVRHLTSSSSFYMLTNCVGSCVTDPLQTTSTVRLYNVSGIPPALTTVTHRDLATSTSSAPPNADQPFTTTQLVTNDNRILAAVWENNTLWYSLADSCIPTGDTVARSCIRLDKITTSLVKSPTLDQDFDYSQVGVSLYYPAVSVYHGQVVLVYGFSSSSIFPSLGVTGRVPSDPPNTLRTPTTFASGSTSDFSSRYGDYFGAATDPSPTLSSIVWVAGEYRTSNSNAFWSTSIAEVGSLVDIALPVNLTGTVAGVNVATTGNILVRSNLTFSGNLTVTATNATGGTILFSKMYSLQNIPLQSSGSSFKSTFVLNVPGTPYPLSSDILLTVTSVMTVTISGSVTRQLDMSGAGPVNIVDVGIVFHQYGMSVGNPSFDPTADLLGTGTVDIVDVGIILFYFGAASFS